MRTLEQFRCLMPQMVGVRALVLFVNLIKGKPRLLHGKFFAFSL